MNEMLDSLAEVAGEEFFKANRASSPAERDLHRSKAVEAVARLMDLRSHRQNVDDRH